MTSEQTTPIHVAAGVICDSRGRILLARRTEGRDLAGAWEFPGGKIESGETAVQALKRELFEELGIRVETATPFISIPQHYPNKSIVLDVYKVGVYTGKPQGREKQALAWSPPEKLSSYPMPAADRPVVAALTLPSMMAITPEFLGDKKTFLGRVEKQIKSGIKMIQVRGSSEMTLVFRELAADIRTLCLQQDALCFINQHIELAHELGCGVHLKSSQLHDLDIEQKTEGLMLTAACHNKHDLLRAQAIDVDFALLSPIAKTPSHLDVEPMGWMGFSALRAEVSIPIFALGGLAAKDLAIARSHGAQGIAGISRF
jgi:8-oxo-dGTP diphosphatase